MIQRGMRFGGGAVLIALVGIGVRGEVQGQILINEVQQVNASSWADETGDYGDWFELYNPGTEPVSLAGWTVSDGGTGWALPPSWLGPGAHRVVFASGEDRWGTEGGVHHVEWPVAPGSLGQYLVPTSEPSGAWRLPGFSATGWGVGPTGMGFADGDDGTTVPQPALSVYVRVAFNLTDPTDIVMGRLMMDYDDGIVCWLNGVELARAMVGVPGDLPGFQTPASGGHEAVGYQGGTPEEWELDAQLLQSVLLAGENVLGWQVHNVELNSSDLTGNVRLALGMGSAAVQTTLAPPGAEPPATPSHTDFGLSSGETLTLRNPDGEVVDEVVLPVLDTDHVYRRSSDGMPGWCVGTQPTPGGANTGPCAAGYAPEPAFSLPGGAYETGVYLELSVPEAVPNSVIRYTVDGSVPTEASMLYTGPLAVAGTAVVSARTFVPEGLPSRVQKQTYLVAEEGLGLPVVSLSCDPDHLWHPETGIHVFGPPDYDTGVPFWGANFWENWERPAFVEYFDADGVRQLSGPVGVKIHGGWSRSREQKSLRVQAKGAWGMEDLAYPMLADKGHITRLKGFNLRNGGNDYDQYRFHDALLQRVLRSTHVDYMAYAPAVVFLNGEYWGFMEIRENMDVHYITTNHPIDAEDVTLLSMNYMGVNVLSGTYDDFLETHAALTTANPAAAGFLDLAESHLDLENYIDYIIAQTYWCNGDWSWGYQNNTKLWFDRRPGGKWRFMLMDLDFGMGLAGNSPTDDYIVAAGDDGLLTDQIFAQLKQNPAFRHRFINRYADLINTVFQADAVAAMAHAMRDEVAPAFERHRLRWNTNGDALNGALEGRLDWAEQRVDGARMVVQNHFGLAGQVDITLDVVPAGAGRIQISTIAPDEMDYPWSGVYFRGVPVRVTALPSPGYVFSHWTGNDQVAAGTTAQALELYFNADLVFEAVFEGEPAGPHPLSVTELMFHPDDFTDSGDWLELRNNLTVPLDLTGWRITDANPLHGYTFPTGATVPPGGRWILAEDPMAFASVHPDVAGVWGPAGFGWSNAGDEVQVLRPNGSVMLTFSYSDGDVGLGCSDGCGHSRGHLWSSTNYGPAHWYLECEGGSPGTGPTPCSRPVWVSELMYDAPGTGGSGDWVEFQVPLGAPGADLTGWTLRDGGGNAFVFPSGSVLAPGDHGVVARDVSAFGSVYPGVAVWAGPLDFGWSSTGDRLQLYDATGRLRLAFDYGTQSPWPAEAAGAGAALVYDGTGHPCAPGSWFASCPMGSPGLPHEIGCGPTGIDGPGSPGSPGPASSPTATSLRVSPNPTHGLLHWTCPATAEAVSWTLRSTDGRPVHHAQGGRWTHQSVDLTSLGLSAGLYLLEVRSAEGHRWSTQVLFTH